MSHRAKFKWDGETHWLVTLSLGSRAYVSCQPEKPRPVSKREAKAMVREWKRTCSIRAKVVGV